jgi:MFS family permease
VLDALRIRDFRLLLTGSVISSAGTYLLVVALPYRVFQLTGSTTATGLSVVAQALPALAIGPVAGVFVDRWDLRRVLVVADLFRAVALVTLLFADRPGHIAWVYVGLVAENAGTVFFQPAARAFLPALVGTGPVLGGANSLLAASNAVVGLVGPPVGAVLLTSLGLTGLVVLDMVSYAGSAIAVAATRGATPAREPATSVHLELVAGLRATAQRPTLRWLFVLGFVFLGANAVFTALLIPFLALRFGGHAGAIGLLLSALGLGYLLGAPLAGVLARDRSARLPVTFGLAGVGACFVVLANAPTFPVAVVATGLAGLPGSVLLGATQTTIQRETPAALLGRVGATFFAGNALAELLGASVGSATRGPPSLVLTVSAAAIVASAGVAVVALRR